MSSRQIDYRCFRNSPILEVLGLSQDMLYRAILSVYRITDAIDNTLVSSGEDHLFELLELNNLSAIIGNLFRSALVKVSNGLFIYNTPYKFPDLISQNDRYSNLEIKVALEEHMPKGHLIKPGAYLVIRYVLAPVVGEYRRKIRGPVVWIWEIRVGFLKEEHFCFSDTENDSGKTAPVNKLGMDSLDIVFYDKKHCPLIKTGPLYKQIIQLINRDYTNNLFDMLGVVHDQNQLNV